MTAEEDCNVERTARSHGVEPEQAFLPKELPPKTMPIAIVGMGCRFSGGATNPTKLWDLCLNGRSAWSEIPKSRFNAKAWYHPNKENRGTSFVQGGYFLSHDISAFDASFFNLSSEAAANMDPEVRMQLECVYEAMESAGMSMEQLSGSNTAVCAGTCFRDFHDSHMRDPTTLERTYLTGNGMAMISNRISHFYNLQGPSIAVDTGCSTTLTLLHLACQSLRAGEAEMAVVGGSNVLVNPDMFISGTILGLLSAEGKCFAFDSRASGYGRGEGVASLILKPLDAAIRDGDPVRAVIRETGINQDGKTPTLTSPSCDAQQQLIKDCYERAGLDPRYTGYVEAHGTGTQAGDSTEARALGSILAAQRPREDPLFIGSVKTNIGHTEASSGLAGVIKAVLCIENECIPPSLNFEQPNPAISFGDLRLRVPTSKQLWPTSSLLRASVNNFGYGGSNAHAIIEHSKYLMPHYQRAQSVLDQQPSRSAARKIVHLSAKDESSANAQVEGLRSHIGHQLASGHDPSTLLESIAYTLGQRRSRFPWNAAFTVSNVEDILDLKVRRAQRTKKAPRIGFVFSGQGAQWHAMGRELLTEYPVFLRAIQQADEILRDLGAPWSLLEELNRERDYTRINEVAISLPASVAIQLALVILLQSWGILPAGVTGHSSGEVSAAFAAGALDMRSALAIVYSRGTLTTEFQRILDRRGGMLAVGLSREDSRQYLKALKSGQLVIACVNSPNSVTISGDLTAIEELEARLVEEKIFARRLRVDAAYHSHHMLGIAEPYRAALENPGPTKSGWKEDIIYSSPVTGARIESATEIASAAHWVKNMVQPVEFLDCLANMCLDPVTGTSSIDVLLEIGPAAALQGPIRQNLRRSSLKDKSISYLSCLVRGEDAVESMQTMACNLLSGGNRLNLEAINFPHGFDHMQVLTDLDPYPFNHQVQHWQESRSNRTLRNRTHPVHDLLGAATADSNPMSRRWRHIIRPSEIPWVRDHVFQGDIVYPGAGYISMAIEAARQTLEADVRVAKYELRRVDIKQALLIPDTSSGREVQLCLQHIALGALESGWYLFKVLSVDQNDVWNLHCEGQILVTLERPGTEAAVPWTNETKETKVTPWFTHQSPRQYSPAELYTTLERTGLKYGTTFSNIDTIQVSGKRSRCEFKVADCASTMPEQFQHDHVLHPSTLDAVFQAVYTTLPNTAATNSNGMLPRSIQSLIVCGTIPAQPGCALAVKSEMRKLSSQGFESDATVILASADEIDTPMLELTGLYCQSLGPAKPIEIGEEPNKSFLVDWKPDIHTLQAQDWLWLFDCHRLSDHSIAAFIQLLLHKTPAATILDISGEVADSFEAFLQTCGALHYTHALPEQIAQSDNGKENSAYDLVLVPVAREVQAVFAQLKDVVKPGCFVLLIDESQTAMEATAGVELLKDDFAIYTMDGRPSCITIAVRNESPAPQQLHDATIIYAGAQPTPEWMTLAESALQLEFDDHITMTWSSILESGSIQPANVIFLDDPTKSVLTQPSEADFRNLKLVLLNAQSILWVSTGGAIGCESPTAAMHSGLLRTLRCENPFKRYVSLDLEFSSQFGKTSQAESIARAFKIACVTIDSDAIPRELEYAVREGTFHIPRIIEDAMENTSMASDEIRSELTPFFNPDRNIRLGVGSPGLLDSLVFVDDNTADGSLPVDHVQIRPAAFGLNFRDVMVAMGQLDESRMGFECSGYIEAIGPEAKARGFAVGDPVFAFLRGYFANKIRIHHTSVAKIPEGVDITTAASIPLVFITAYHALHNMARIQKGERVLIHSGTGGVGQAAIQLAKLTGAEVFVTVGSQGKQDFLVSTYGVPADHIFNSRNASFAKEVLEKTQGRGMDVVLNSLAGSLLAATWSCIAPLGRFIEIGKRDLELNNSLEMGPFTRSVSFASLDLITLGELRGDIVADIFAQINALFRVRCIQAVSPITTFSISEAEKAYRTMQAGKHMGKIVLVPSAGDIVKATVGSTAVTLSPDHTYLIVGGLGGIGRSIATWMVERGAKHLVLLSRRADRLDDDTSRWLDNLRHSEAQIVVEACDVASKSHLAPCLMKIMLELPPIKGVIQAAMVLKDTLFDNMDITSYASAILPKVQGSWNLHELLLRNLDFFIMLSSISGFGGNSTQANYAAGSTYQDALARYRTAQGRAAVSIDLGMVKDVGILAGAEGRRAAAHLKRLGMRALDETQVLALVEAAIQRGTPEVKRSQMVTGIPSSAIRPDNISSEDQAIAPFWLLDPRFLALSASPIRQSQKQVAAASLADHLSDRTISDEDARQIFTKALQSKLATMFVVAETDIDTEVPLSQHGVDSLLAVEMRNWVSAVAKAECSVFDIMQAPSLTAFAEKLLERSSLRQTMVKTGVQLDIA